MLLRFFCFISSGSIVTHTIPSLKIKLYHMYACLKKAKYIRVWYYWKGLASPGALECVPRRPGGTGVKPRKVDY